MLTKGDARRAAGRTGIVLAALALMLPVTMRSAVTGAGGAGVNGAGAGGIGGGGAAYADEVRDRQRAVLDTLDLTAAWRITRGRGVTVGLIDTGVDAGHPDLRGSVTIGPNYLSEVDRGTRPRRLHGTMMASLIAGHGHGAGGRDGVMGVAPEARVLSLRSVPDKEDSNFAAAKEVDRRSLSRAIRHAADQKVGVINLSLGTYGDNAEQRKAVAYAIERGVVVVASAGNDGDKKRKLDKDGFAPYFYPASYPGVIGVGATTPRHTRTSFSNRNYSVLVSAPGDDIVAAGGDDDYRLGGGTSQAGALVSGVAALIRARHPRLAPALVAQALVASTGHRPGEVYDAEVGYGEVNAARALRAADRLARYAPAGAGLGDAQRFASSEPKPVRVIDRPAWVATAAVTVMLVALGCALAGFVVTGLLARRRQEY